MKITDIRVWHNADQESSLLGICQVTLDNELVLTGLKVFQTENGYSVRYPKNSGSKKNLCFYFPQDSKFKEYLEREILSKITGE